MPAPLTRFATQIDLQLLDDVRGIAARDGRQLTDVIDEALRDFIDKRKRGKLRPEVLTALGESLAEYKALYRELAK